MSSTVERQDGGVAILTMSLEASRNTFNPENFQPLVRQIESLMEDPSCRAVILTGSGRFFSAGGPIDEFAEAIDDGTIGNMVSEMTNSLHSLILKIRANETVFIAAINGAAAGGGLGLALSADYRICSEKAKIAAAFFGLGASPDGGTTWLLPRLVGSQRAKKFFFNNEVWSANEALAFGAIDEVTSSEDLLERSIKTAKDWGKWSVNSRRSTKQLLDASTSTFFETQLEFERALMVSSAQSPDFAEGVAAFMEKRDPKFSEE
ncbi:MAG TPA: enoyl-CoA hydratase/isomerase family protein [Candidatus Thalassarchaeaceae archaeon]|nr:hypothetical protein [Euryarchaeota archaeon]DAC43052.1 MAG TPA: enoyl-CoA hydratase/isomerase family protein [Candidatus Poseidoniales archaeon]HII35213.1 enoyl-CoA hydratase/isomerase family protein [Candidatus Thalassarchaeaceae archaeon]